MTEETHVKCNKEAELAVMQRDLAENTAVTKEIHRLLKGNGQEGLVTTVALNKQALKRVWWWLGSISTAIITAVAAIAITKTGR